MMVDEIILTKITYFERYDWDNILGVVLWSYYIYRKNGSFLRYICRLKINLEEQGSFIQHRPKVYTKQDREKRNTHTGSKHRENRVSNNCIQVWHFIIPFIYIIYSQT